jgi:hypothetical protein
MPYEVALAFAFGHEALEHERGIGERPSRNLGAACKYAIVASAAVGTAS